MATSGRWPGTGKTARTGCLLPPAGRQILSARAAGRRGPASNPVRVPPTNRIEDDPLHDGNGFQSRRLRLARLLGTAIAAAVSGFLAERAGVPVAWLVGPVVAAVALNWVDRLYPPPAGVLRLAQAVIGLSLGSAFRRDVLAVLADAWPAVSASVLATLAGGVAAGLVLAARARIDRVTALLGFVPGAASGMVAASADLHADPGVVALVQYLRLILVVLSAPALVGTARLLEEGPVGAPPAAVIGESPPAAAGGGTTLSSGGGLVGEVWQAPLPLLAGLAIAALGAAVGKRLPLPAAPLLVAMTLAALTSSAAGLPLMVPGLLSGAALAVLGTWVGSRFERATVERAGRVAAVSAALTVGLFALSVAVGWSLHRFSGIPTLAALLATAPGAIETMTAIAVATGAHPELVLAVHVARFVVALLVGPPLSAALSGRPRRRGSPGLLHPAGGPGSIAPRLWRLRPPRPRPRRSAGEGMPSTRRLPPPCAGRS